MKYIPTEKLIAEIERRRKQRIEANNKIAKGEIFAETEDELNNSLTRYGNRLVYQELFEIICFIETLQQDKDVLDLCSQAWWEDRGWIMIPPDATLKGIEFLLKQVKKKIKQEQPEVDLKVEFHRWLSKEKEEWGGEIPPYGEYGLFNIARHFYELGLNARKEE